jgi:hypothetical protein
MTSKMTLQSVIAFAMLLFIWVTTNNIEFFCLGFSYPSTTKCLHFNVPSSSVMLHARSSGSNGNTSKTKTSTNRGVYVRPSGAIERGSGFFFPGLEGPRVRLFFGSTLIGLTIANHYIGGTASSNFHSGVSFQEGLVILYSGLIFFQSAIEYFKEQRLDAVRADTAMFTAGASTSASSNSNKTKKDKLLEQQWAKTVRNDFEDTLTFRSKVQWAAASYLAMTPTTQILLLTSKTNHDPMVQYRLSSTSDTTMAVSDQTIIQNGIRAALEELKQSQGGRLSLPLTHPAVKALLLAEDSSSGTRTVILQRITENSCWMVSSDQLLASYTSADLKWLGRMAQFVA